MADGSKCANCGVPASLRCAGCMDAPDISYCNTKCQKGHWRNHKARCSNLRKRRKLFRAATILKAALLTYREAFFDIPLAKIELRNGVLYLHRHPSKDISPRPFPPHLTTNVAHKEAALTHNHFSTVSCSIESLDLRIGKPVVPTELVEVVAGPNFGGAPHTVLKVHLSGETWLVDAAGCQYGFRDVLLPFDRYLADKACDNLMSCTLYTASETTDFDFLEPLFANYPHMKRSHDRERMGRLHFAAFIDERVGSGKESFDPSKDLDGSEPKFREKFNKFVAELQTHMALLLLKK
ncbi:hypothetical protein C8J57DRAFT_1421289 [Mycena rebaudengoi]|nr:hypothetical protein C8J57DRAFT_1421289 [Mycena rebaudengoi]